jgi:predicted ATP-grasp superfamily ATP-dependent carboligase
VELGGDDEQVFRRLARNSDLTLVVAPESDRLLLDRCGWVEEEGGRLLGPSAAAVRLTGDKLHTGAHLTARGVSTPRCWPLDGCRPSTDDFPAVLKPRFGAGSQAMFLVGTLEEQADRERQLSVEGWVGESIVQSYAPGKPASIAFLVGPRGCVALPPAAQRLSADGRFRYLGGYLPLPAALAERARRLGERAVEAVPGLAGYVGVDLVLGRAPDGSGDSVIEINPRLTTSYVGLRALCRANLARAMLDGVLGVPVGKIEWHPGSVSFDADGRTTIHSGATGTIGGI